MNAPFNSHHATIAALRAENDELRETVRQLREDLAPAMLFPPAWRLTPQQATLLSCLMATSPNAASFRRIRAALYQYDEPPDTADDQVSVLVYGIRQRLAAVGIDPDIRSEYGIGYRIPLDARDRLKGAPEPIEKADPAWWAVARRLRAQGATYDEIAATCGKHRWSVYRLLSPVARAADTTRKRRTRRAAAEANKQEAA